MSDWKIGLTPAASEKTPTIIGPLTALMAWKRLSKPARSAVAVASLGGVMTSFHPNTMHALERHGFVIWDFDAHEYQLTEAARAVAKWCVKP